VRAAAKKNPHANSIRFYRIRGTCKEASDISNPRLFLREKLWLSFSFSPFSLDAGSSRWLSLSPLAAFNFSNDRLTQYWKLAPEGNEEGMREKRLGSGRRRYFMTTIFMISLLHVDSGIERLTKGPPNGTGRTSWKCKRCLSSDQKIAARFFLDAREMMHRKQTFYVLSHQKLKK